MLIRVGQEFVEAERSCGELGLIKDEILEDIRYDHIMYPAIAEFYKTVARKKTGTDKVEA